MSNVVIRTDNNIDWNCFVSGDGEPLVFLHGWGVDGRIFRQQSKFFSKNYKTISIDFPGHGKSGWGKISFDVLINDLNQIFDQLQLKNINIVASSFGGLVALKYFDLFPKMIRRIILVGSMPKFAKSEDYPYGLDIDQMKQLSNRVRANHISAVNIFFRSLFSKKERASRRFKWMMKFRQDNQLPEKFAMLEYLEMIEQQDLRYVFDFKNLPVCFVHGTDDSICPIEIIELLKQKLEDVKFHYFEECGHFPFLSEPYEFNNVVEEMLR